MVSDYTALDLETTGLDPKRDKIIEIGAVKVRDGKVAERFQSFVDPGRALEEHVRELTGIGNGMLEGAPDMGELLEPLLAFLGDDVLVEHRILFDYSFEKKGIDTLKLARKFLPDLESRKLEYLCRHYGLEHTAHRALGDAQAASELYLKLAGLFYVENTGGEGGKDFEPQPLVYRVKKETPITKSQKERLYKLLDKHKISMECRVEKLTRNEADRIMNQIFAAYGR